MSYATKVDDTQFIQDEMDRLERELSHLAYQWRALGSAQADIEQQYSAKLLRMLELGFVGTLDADAELPDEKMPLAYLRLQYPDTAYDEHPESQ